MNTILENNKIIAEFVGYTYSEGEPGYIMYQILYNNNEIIYLNNTKYHYSYDWLIPVFHKVVNIFKELNLETQTNFIILYDKILNNIENSIDILDLYYSILDFIKEYNKN